MKPRNATINPKKQLARAEAKARRRVEAEQRRRNLAAELRVSHLTRGGRS